MNYYSIYGASLGSRMVFPELRPAATKKPKWTFEETSKLEPMQYSRELGAERIYDQCHARLFRYENGHRITVDDTGTFDISPDGKRFRWESKRSAWPDFVRAHLMGRVLSTSLFLDGWLPMHGSAVAFPSGIVGFLAPKGFGKSSIALALTEAGGRLVTDDTLPVEPAAVPMAWPGVHSLRMNTDSIRAVGLDAKGEQTREGKTLVTDIAQDKLQTTPAPLVALYLLNPLIADGAQVAVVRVPFSAKAAALGMMAHIKIAGMLGPSFVPTLLDRAVEVLRVVPVYRLDMARDLARVPDMAETIASWHA